MATAKWAPSILSAVENATVDEALKIIERFQSLPECGMSGQIERAKTLAAAVSEAEKRLSQTRLAFRLVTTDMARDVIARWSKKEIFDATGY